MSHALDDCPFNECYFLFSFFVMHNCFSSNHSPPFYLLMSAFFYYLTNIFQFGKQFFFNMNSVS